MHLPGSGQAVARLSGMGQRAQQGHDAQLSHPQVLGNDLWFACLHTFATVSLLVCVSTESMPTLVLQFYILLLDEDEYDLSVLLSMSGILSALCETQCNEHVQRARCQ